MYYCATDAIAETIANCPTPHAFTLLVEEMSDNDCIQTLKTWCDPNGYNATVFVRSGYPNWGNGWRQLATATPPQEFNLSLAEDITTSSRCVYWKNQFDEVTVICDCNIPEGVSATAFAALPAGFRPAARCIFNASMWESGSARSGGCSIDVFPNGQLDFYSGGYTTDIRIWGLCKFVAAS